MRSPGLSRPHGWGGESLSLACRRSFGPLMNLSLDSSDNNDHPALVWIGCALARPWPQAASMVRFDDSDDFLLSPQAFDFPFYVVRVEQQGVSGLDLIRLIRRRSSVGILAISNLEGDGFVAALEAGADMFPRIICGRPFMPFNGAQSSVCRLRPTRPGGCWRIRRSCRRPMVRG